MSPTQIPTKLEIHYYLKDNVHSMDAFVYNECEHELLILFKEFQSLLSLKEYSIDVEAIAEGGIKSRIVLFIKDKQFVLFALGIIGGVITTKFNEDKELNLLEKEKLKLEIQKLKKELNQNQASDTLHVSITDIINSDIKIVKRKSNYYASLLKDERITKIGTSVLDSENQIIGEEKFVKRSQFREFVLNTDELESVIVEDAIIEIVSPVLKDRRIKWIGIYEGKNLSFKMEDLHFTKQILMEQVQFKRGTYIECVLEIKKKLNEIGEVKIDGYNVLVVIRSFDHSMSFETPQGIEYKKNGMIGEDLDENQLTEK
jgi:hypothetical protein